MPELKTIARTLIDPNPDQPRKAFDPDALAELANSIREHGIIQPLTVLPADQDGRFRIVAGERRWRAAELAGLEELPCVVTPLDELKQQTVMLVENLQRAELSPLEEAQAFQVLRDKLGLTETEIAARVGKSQPHVANRLRLLMLPGSAQEAIAKGIISASHGRALTPIAHAPRLVDRIIANVAQYRTPVSRLESELSQDAWRLTKPLDSSSISCEKPKFDPASCVACADACKIEVGDYNGHKQFESRCTNPECWEKKQKQTELQKIEDRRRLLAKQANGKENALKLIDLSHDDYVSMESYEFDGVDKSDCPRCNYQKLGQREDGKTELICLNRACLAQKKAMNTRARNKAIAAIEAERQQILRSQIAAFTEPTKELLVWIAALAFRDLPTDQRRPWEKRFQIPKGSETEFWVTLKARLEAMNKPELVQLIVERGIQSLDTWYLPNDLASEAKWYVRYLGIRFPVRSVDVYAGKAKPGALYNPTSPPSVEDPNALNDPEDELGHEQEPDET